MELHFFTDQELRCPETMEYVLSPSFGKRLDELRDLYGKPMVLTSAARSRQHNKNIGGHPRSLHVYDYPFYDTGGCCAVDVRIRDRSDRVLFVKLALEQEFSIGINFKHNFVHVDDRSRILGLPQALFGY